MDGNEASWSHCLIKCSLSVQKKKKKRFASHIKYSFFLRLLHEVQVPVHLSSEIQQGLCPRDPQDNCKQTVLKKLMRTHCGHPPSQNSVQKGQAIKSSPQSFPERGSILLLRTHVGADCNPPWIIGKPLDTIHSKLPISPWAGADIHV